LFHLAWASPSPVPPSQTVHAVLPHTAFPQAVDRPHSAVPRALAGDPSVAASPLTCPRGASGCDSPWAIPRSSLVASHTWLEALRSNRVMLSRLSSLLLAPPTSARHFAVSQGRCLSTSWLPGTAGWRPVALCLPASRRISPVPRTTFWPFRAPCAGRFLDTRSKVPGVVHGLRPLGKGSTPPVPPRRRTGVTTLQASRDVTDWSVAPPRFEPGLSTTHGGFTTGDLGVSPDRTSTGWLSPADRL